MERELIEKFLKKLPDYMTRMYTLLRSQDSSGLSFIAHDLKGLGGSFGFPLITEISTRIEAKARRQDLTDVAADLEALSNYCAKLV